MVQHHREEPRLALAVASALDPSRAIVAAAPVPLRCQRYSAGHSVHPIQARLACCGEGTPPVEGVVLDITSGVISVRADGVVRRFRNHETGLLRRVLEENAFSVLLRSRRVLAVPAGEIEHLFSVAGADEEWMECSPRRATACEVPRRGRH